MTVTRRAHAKINLCLAVSPPQPPESPRPGWHRIATWMAAIDLHDDVSITRKGAGDFTTYDITWADDASRPTPIDWNLSQDLASRAHLALEQHVGRLLLAEVRVVKGIPVGGGLGGGSSDAAATLLALNEAFALRLSVEELREIGAPLGSDVAFFLDENDPPRPAFVGEFGDKIERLERVPAELILIIPPFACATPEVYKAFDGQLAQRVLLKRAELGPAYELPSDREELVRKRIAKAHHAGAVRDQFLVNELYRAAVEIQPGLGPLAARIANLTRHDVHMTGSGSCLFLVTDPERAAPLLERVSKANDPQSPFIAVRTRTL